MMTIAHFASAADTAEQVPRVEELAPDCYGFISGHDPNCGFVVGRDAVLAVDTRATPPLARDLLRAIRSVTDFEAEPARGSGSRCAARPISRPSATASRACSAAWRRYRA